MKKILVIDHILMMKLYIVEEQFIKKKDKIYCLFVTNLSPRHKYFKKRKKEIENVAKSFKFDGYVLDKFQPSV